jgi:hypothetical protein
MLAANAEKLARLQTWPEGQQGIGFTPPVAGGYLRATTWTRRGALSSLLPAAPTPASVKARVFGFIDWSQVGWVVVAKSLDSTSTE